MTNEELELIQIGDVLKHKLQTGLFIKVDGFETKKEGGIGIIFEKVRDTMDDVPVDRTREIYVVKIAGITKLRIEYKDYFLGDWVLERKTEKLPKTITTNDIIQAINEFPKAEAVNHPSYYGGADNVYEVRKVRKALGFNYNLGNTFKYIARAGKKDKSKHLEDLEKALFYLKDEIAEVKEMLNVTR